VIDRCKKASSPRGDMCIAAYWVAESDTNTIYDDPVFDEEDDVASFCSKQSVPQMKNSVRSFLDSPFKKRGKHISKKTQEKLISEGIPSNGLDLESEGVVMNGQWLTAEESAELEKTDEEEILRTITTSNRTSLLSAAAAALKLVRNKKPSVEETLLSDMDDYKHLMNNDNSVLQIDILEARGLLAMDDNGLSDPYCIVKIRSKTIRTSMKPKTLTPVWNETVFIGGDSQPDVIISRDDVITIILKDHDYIGRDDTLGMVQVPLGALIGYDHDPTTIVSIPSSWYSIQICDGMKTVRGEIKIRFAYHPRASFTTVASPSFQSDGFPPLKVDSSVEEEFGELFEKPRPLLTVTIIQARDLKISDANGLSDPFVKVKCRNSEFQTKVVKKSLHPVWNQQFTFGGELNCLTASDELMLTLYDEDTFTADDQIGFLSLPLWDLIGNDPTVPLWYALEEVDGRSLKPDAHILKPAAPNVGQIQLRISFEFPKDPLATISENTRNLLDIMQSRRLLEYKQKYKGKVWFYKCKVTVHSARYLPEKYSDGSCDSRVRISCGDHKAVVTKSMVETLLPTWRQSFIFSKSSFSKALGLFNDDAFVVVLEDGKPEAKFESSDSTPNVNAQGEHEFGRVCIGIDYLVSKLGYIDKDGLEYTGWFEMANSEPSTNRIPQLKLSFKLTPIAETRLMERRNLGVHVCHSLAIGKSSGVVFPRVSIGSNTIQGSSVNVIHGHANFFHALHFENLNDADLDQDAKLTILDAKDGMSLGDFTMPLDELLEQEYVEKQSWVTSNDHSDYLNSPQKLGFAVLAKPGPPKLKIGARMVKVYEFLKPLLGNVEFSIAKVKLDSNTFTDVCVSVRHGNRYITSKVYRGIVAINFLESEFKNSFPVDDYQEPIIIDVWSMVGACRQKRLGSVQLTIYDIIEYEALAVFNSPNVLLPVKLDTLKLELFDGSKKKGSVRLLIRFNENMLNGSLAVNAHPAARPKKKFSLQNIRHELNRFVSLIKDLGYLFGSVGYVLGWHDVNASFFALGVYVLFCTLDFWSARILVVFPALAVLYILNRHRQRAGGKFVSNILQKSGNSEIDLKARLTVSVIRGRSLLPMDDGVVSDPLYRVSIIHSWRDKRYAPKKVLIGQSRTHYRTLFPNWALTPIGFKAQKSAALIKWRKSADSFVPAFETFIPRYPHQNMSVEIDIIGTRGIVESSLADSKYDSRDFVCTVQCVSQANIESHISGDDSFGLKGWGNYDVLGKMTDMIGTDHSNSNSKKITKPRALSIASENTDIAEYMRRYSSSSIGGCESLVPEGLEWLSMPFSKRASMSLQSHHFTHDEKVAMASTDAAKLSRSTSAVRAMLNPQWNEHVVFYEQVITSTRGIVIVVSANAGSRKKVDFRPVGYGFLPLKSIRETCDGHWYGWVALETLSKNKWDVIGEVLVSLRVAGDLDNKSGHPSVDSDDDTEDITDVDEKIESEFSWDDSCSSIVIDVYDEDDFAKKEFLGTVSVPLTSIIGDSNKAEQEVFESWLPLTLAFDNSKSERVLFGKALGIETETTHRKSSLANLSLETESFNFEEDLKRRELRDLNLNFIRSSDKKGAPFGEVLVRLQVVLPEPGAERAYRQLQEAKEADKSTDSKIFVWRMIQKKGQGLQNSIQGVNDTLESIKNLFNWTHPRKTKFMLYLMLFLCVLFLFVPSRIILLFLGIFFFTERFRPLGTMGIRLKHMMALIPTQDDLHGVYTTGFVLGNSDAPGADDENASRNSAQFATLKGSLFHVLKQRVSNLGPPTQSRQAQVEKTVVSEQDCKFTGYLRTVSALKNMKKVKRVYYAIAHGQLMYWSSKDDLLITAASGTIRGIVNVIAVTKTLATEMEQLKKAGVSESAILDCTIAVTHPVSAAVPQDEGDIDIQKIVTRKRGPSYGNVNTQPRVVTFLIASSTEKRDKWIKFLENYCVTKHKANKLL